MKQEIVYKITILYRESYQNRGNSFPRSPVKIFFVKFFTGGRPDSFECFQSHQWFYGCPMSMTDSVCSHFHCLENEENYEKRWAIKNKPDGRKSYLTKWLSSSTRNGKSLVRCFMWLFGAWMEERYSNGMQSIRLQDLNDSGRCSSWDRCDEMVGICERNRACPPSWPTRSTWNPSNY